MNVARHLARAGVATAAVLLAGCGTTVTGSAGPDGAHGSGPTATTAIPEEPADWAIAALDPCGLLTSPAGTEARRIVATRPHSCRLDRGRTRLDVTVGSHFDTTDRAAAAPVTVGGLTAYRSRETDVGPYDPAVCRVDLPISATRSVRVEMLRDDGDLDSSCAGARDAAGQVAAKLGNPAASTRTSPAASLGRWHACDLLESALRLVADRSAHSSPSADACRASAQGTDPLTAPSVQIEIRTGPETIVEPGADGTAIELPRGPAMQLDHPSGCQIAFVAEIVPDAPAEHAAQIVTVTQRRSPDACRDAAAAGAGIQEHLATSPAPAAPEAPPRLGFATGEADDVMPAACGVFGNTTARTCRAPRPVEAPRGAQAVLDAMSGPDAADVSCAILRDSATAVLERVELAASGDDRCIGLADNGFSIVLGFDPTGTVETRCGPGSRLDGEDVRAAGRSGRRCNPSATTYDLVLPAHGSVPGRPGLVQLAGRLDHPRGDLTIDPPSDPRLVRELTTRIADNVVGTYLRS